MASSSGSHAAPKTRALVTSNTGDLPLDPLYEILLRLPAKLLCRLRTVCRSWRSILSDPRFAAAHAARHPGPLIIATVDEGHEGSDVLVNIMDLSGQILKQVRGVPGQRVVTTALDLVCLEKIDSSRSSYQFRRSYFERVVFLPDQLLNTATGAVYQIPESFAKEHVDIASNIVSEPGYLLGQVTSTGEYKVFRKLIHYPCESHPGQQLLEICTINSSSHTRWRAVAPLANIWLGVVIDGIVYSICCEWHNSIAIDDQVIDKHLISTFDLETEKWGPFMRGPAQVFEYHPPVAPELTFANLNGSLAAVNDPAPSMNFWILMDSAKGLWVKKYVIQFEEYSIHKHVNPLVVLGDGRVVLYKEDMRFLQIYDPRTNTLTDSVGCAIFMQLLCSEEIY